MRSTDERIVAVGRRTREIKQQQKLRRSRITGLSGLTAALALVVGVGLAMPGIMAQIGSPEGLSISGMASIFSAGSGIGYVMVSLLSFGLGVCVTLLCLHLHRTAKNPNPVDAKEDKQDG